MFYIINVIVLFATKLGKFSSVKHFGIKDPTKFYWSLKFPDDIVVYSDSSQYLIIENV